MSSRHITSFSIVLVLAACAPAATSDNRPGVAVTGPWGGDHVRLELTSAGGDVEYDCAHGGLTEPVRPGPRGDFDVRGVHVRESVRLECSISDAYRFWRRLEDLPRFMSHLRSVTQTSDRQSHWIAAGPAGIAVEWDAEIITEEENRTLAWRSLPGSDIVTAGSVNFEPVRGGRSTELRVHLQYAPPAGRAGALIASLFGREPSQTIREDLRHFKQLLEAGEMPRTTAGTKE